MLFIHALVPDSEFIDQYIPDYTRVRTFCGLKPGKNMDTEFSANYTEVTCGNCLRTVRKLEG